MALTIDTTLTGINSNSYVDQPYADDYWDSHFNATKSAYWSNLSDDQKTNLLIMACRVIETARFTNFVPISEYTLHYDHVTGQVLDITLTREPVRFYYYQRLQFPRNLDFNPQTQVLYIQPAVQMAQCEQAVYMAQLDETTLSNRLQGVLNDTVSIGRSQIHLNQQYATEGSMFAPMALEFIRPFLIRGARIRRA